MTTGLSVGQLAGELRRLGVVAGDVLMVHASLRRLGPVGGGAAGVISALDQAVGRAGTLLMVLGARDDFSWVNERPEDERPGLLAGIPPFDHRTTPADPDVGVLAEVFRVHPGTSVNNHPEARFAARGRLSEALIESPPWDDYYGRGSPLERLVEADGKVLRIGADPDTVTLLHYAEYLAEVPDKRRVLRHRRVLQNESAVIKTVSTLDDSQGIVDYPGRDYFVDILAEFLAAGGAAIGQVGQARSELFRAVDLVRFATDWMNRNLVRSVNRADPTPI
ncbi:MAG TPA: AAC(3) family N-acetyltransferase [Acidimicrobiia bacterium]|nr:AAC(3) family N-acetyltransferase [Acidimicrobiia bacterium]